TVDAGAATHFSIAGSSTQTAGSAQTLTITARDANGNTATAYTGDKSLTFSGANASPDSTNPTVTNKSGTAVAFGTAETISFSNGVGTAGGSMKLYKAESATVHATDGTIATSPDLAVTVSSAAASALAV